MVTLEFMSIADEGDTGVFSCCQSVTASAALLSCFSKLSLLLRLDLVSLSALRRLRFLGSDLQLKG